MPITAIVSRSSSSVKPAAVPADEAAEPRAVARAAAETLAWNRTVNIALHRAPAEQRILFLQQIFDFPQFPDHVGPLIDGIGKGRLAGLGGGATNAVKA